MRAPDRARTAGLLIAILALSGCVSAADDLGTSPPASQPTTPPEEPEEEQPAVAIPDHVPVEIAPGGDVDGVFEPAEGTLQDYWLVRVLYPESAESEIVAFYDGQLDELGFLEQKFDDRPGVTRWTTTPDSRVVQLTVESGDAFYPGSAVLEIGWNE